VAIERAFEPGDELRDGVMIGVLLGAGRGHEAALQLRDRILPDLGIRRDLIR